MLDTFHELELAGAEAQKVGLTADAFDVIENSTGIFNRRLADHKHMAVLQMVFSRLHS